jgi:hypothetical protein
MVRRSAIILDGLGRAVPAGGAMRATPAATRTLNLVY